ncbi:hypothetical protein ACIQU6_30815 [Streptomyces sp. NPDC090442]|uniref:hypothetical protein n=1 Tax=Streptomyces sp. NPDC090442 TaxID=3365962 RepID=UPI0037F17D57
MLSRTAFERALDVAVEAGAVEAAVRGAWTVGGVAEIPIGARWHVVRVAEAVGRQAVDELRTRRLPHGPALLVPSRVEVTLDEAGREEEAHYPGYVEFVVPRGERAHWPPLRGRRRELKLISQWAADGITYWPAPIINTYTGRRTLGGDGRTWITVPHPLVSSMTPPEALASGIAAALEELTPVAVGAR